MKHVDERRWRLDPARTWGDVIDQATAELRHEGINNGHWHIQGEWLMFLIHPGRRHKKGRRPIAQCGTDGGYFRHLRTLKQPACPECCEAHARANREQSWRRGVQPSKAYSPAPEPAEVAPEPVAQVETRWVRRGLVWVAVESSEVAA